MKWESVYGKYWRGAEDLIAKIDFIIPLKSHSKIQIRPVPSLLNQGTQGDFAFISGQQKKDAMPFKTAYGTATLKPEWVQIANPTENPILIRKGEIVVRGENRISPQASKQGKARQSKAKPGKSKAKASMLTRTKASTQVRARAQRQA